MIQFATFLVNGYNFSNFKNVREYRYKQGILLGPVDLLMSRVSMILSISSGPVA